MNQEEILVGIDLGSSNIRVAVGQRVMTEESKTPRLNIVGVVEVPSEGISKGVITNIEDAGRSITSAIDKAEKMSGFPIQSAWVSISGTHIVTQQSRGIIAVAKTNGEISEDDVNRAIQASSTVTTPPNYEILHTLPRNFQVDSQGGVKNPVGMSGMRLEVDTYIIEGMSSQITNLTKAVWITGLEIEDLVFNPLAGAEAALTSKQKELGVVLVNVGSSTTTYAVFEEGDLMHTGVIPFGSEHVTSDIAIVLRTSIETAEQIKNKYGLAYSVDVDKHDEIQLSEFDPSEDVAISKKYLAEIIEARVEDIFKKIDAELKKIDRSGQLPAGVVLCGGGAKLPRIIDLAKDVLELPASLGYPSKVSTVIDQVHDLSMTTAVGLVLWGDKVLTSGQGASRFKTIKGVTETIKGWFKTLMP